MNKFESLEQTNENSIQSVHMSGARVIRVVERERKQNMLKVIDFRMFATATAALHLCTHFYRFSFFDSISRQVNKNTHPKNTAKYSE